MNARTELAIRYNDISPLENHHASVAFDILSRVCRFTYVIKYYSLITAQWINILISNMRLIIGLYFCQVAYAWWLNAYKTAL